MNDEEVLVEGRKIEEGRAPPRASENGKRCLPAFRV
jgi:hypothetical protein